jgi:hypothetical protein
MLMLRSSLLLALALAAPSLAAVATAQTVQVGTHANVQSFTAGTAAPTVAEASDFTAVADTAGSLSAKTFRFYDASDAHCYQPWYDVDNGSTAPAAVTGCTLVEVDIATGDTATTVAGNTRTVLNAAPYSTYFAITGATTHVIVTSLTKGSATDGNIGDSGFAISKTQGVSSTAVIVSTSVLPALNGWRICNASANSSTWMAVGKAVDTETDGVRLKPGGCYDCPSCAPDTLRLAKVSAQASSNAYAVTQFKQ